MRSGDLPGGVYAEIDGHVHTARHVRGQPYVTLVDDGPRVIDRASVGRLFRRIVSGLWNGEPVTVWAARKRGDVRVQFAGDDLDRARSLGMRGDRTVWDLDVPSSEVTVTHIDEVELD